MVYMLDLLNVLVNIERSFIGYKKMSEACVFHVTLLNIIGLLQQFFSHDYETVKNYMTDDQPNTHKHISWMGMT